MRPEQRHLRWSICSTRSQRPQKQLASLKHVFAKARRALPLTAPCFEPAVLSGAWAQHVACCESKDGGAQLLRTNSSANRGEVRTKLYAHQKHDASVPWPCGTVRAPGWKHGGIWRKTQQEANNTASNSEYCTGSPRSGPGLVQHGYGTGAACVLCKKT
jgi:hypothetical protein